LLIARWCPGDPVEDFIVEDFIVEDFIVEDFIDDDWIGDRASGGCGLNRTS